MKTVPLCIEMAWLPFQKVLNLGKWCWIREYWTGCVPNHGKNRKVFQLRNHVTDPWHSIQIIKFQDKKKLYFHQMHQVSKYSNYNKCGPGLNIHIQSPSKHRISPVFKCFFMWPAHSGPSLLWPSKVYILSSYVNSLHLKWWVT